MSGPDILLSCAGGDLVLPAPDLVLVDREDGGNLIVNPPRPVWERSALTARELAAWSFLVAAAGEAMLTALPQLAGGCVNYWEAGNWALNVAADPPGPKAAPEHRRVHLHLLGRSRFARNPAWAWGEAPSFPPYAERHVWAAGNRRLDDAECTAIADAARALLSAKYGIAT